MKIKLIYSYLLTFLFFCSTQSQNLVGAWEAMVPVENEKIKTTLRSVVIFSDGYQVNTYFDLETGAFVNTNGGTWSLNGNTITETIEFDTENPERVGSTTSFEIEMAGDELRIKDVPLIWKRIDAGEPGDLAGAWSISQRMRDGELQKRDANIPRKTMKMLSGKRFQWIAYNTETKEFMGTGGGTYTTINGKYTENIEFFSRDDSRVGASLQFDYEIKDGDWHHSGLSSKGKPIYEVWSLRSE